MPQLEFEKFIVPEKDEFGKLRSIEELSDEDKESLEKAGILAEDSNKAGNFVQMNQSVVYSKSFIEGVEILGIREAFKKYDWLYKDYYWKILEKNKDEYTKVSDDLPTDGYFIRVHKGVRPPFPIQSCLYLKKNNAVQSVHNIVIVEEGAKVIINSGCTLSSLVKEGIHIGISEFYVKKGAHLEFTMVHSWANDFVTRPRTAIRIEEGGTYISNYISLGPVKFIESNPTAYLEGKGATAYFNSILYAPMGSVLDVGGKIVFNAEKTKGEIISRSVSGGGKIIARGCLLGNAPNIKAHLECDGLILRKGGIIQAIPILDGRDPDVEMSHEAAVGKIAEEEIEYLMSRGLAREEAISLIIRGFLDTSSMNLPPRTQLEVNRALKQLEEKGF